MRKTLNYYFKNRLNIILIISFLVFLIMFFYLFNSNFIYRYSYYDEFNEYVSVIKPENSPFALLSTIAAILSTAVVTFEFYFKMRKVSVDQMFSLPIKREKIYLSKLIICYLEVIVPVTVGFILSFLMILSKEHMFNLIYFIPFYFGIVFLSVVLVTSFAFLYTRGNAFFDGIVNMLAYIFMLVLIVALITDTFAIPFNKFGSNGAFFIYSPISIFTTWLNKLFVGNEFNFDLAQNISVVIYILFGVVSLFLFIILNREEPSENSTQISNSNFSYRTIIPIYSIVFSATSILSNGFLALSFSSIFTYLAFVLYKRSFKLSKKDYLFIILYIIIGIVLGVCCEQIREVFNEVIIEENIFTY